MDLPEDLRPVKREPVQRISVSLPESVFQELDKLVERRGFESRSQAIAEMIQKSASEHSEDLGDAIMAGTITLFYNESKPGLWENLARIERENVDEVISSQHVLLEKNHVMEVLLVQGPASKLKKISDQLITCKGIFSGRLTLTSTLMPPIHPLPPKS